MSAFVVDQILEILIGGSAYRHANKQKGYKNRATAALLHNTTIPMQDAEVESVQQTKDSNSFTYSSHVLIRNNLHILHVSSSFKYLAKDILCNSWVQSTYIQRTLVGFGGSTADEAA